MNQENNAGRFSKGRLEPQPDRVVYGAFKGMGDLLSAAPVIAWELNAGRWVTLLCFPGKGLEQILELIDFGGGRARLSVLPLPVGLGLNGYSHFFAAAKVIDPTLVWVSPHAPRAASSWRIPLLLWVTKTFYWRRAVLAGAATERLAFLFGCRVDVDRNLPLREREWIAYALATGGDERRTPRRVSFLSPIATAVTEPKKWDLLIHPGANAQNRSWPFDHYAKVVGLLPLHYRLAVLGLPEDIEAMRRAMPRDRVIEFLTGSLQEAIGYMARARAVLTMDSGNVHFASVLGVPAVALFGKSDPATTIAASDRLFPIYERRFDCQPCGAATCTRPEVYCMNAIAPETVAAALLRLLEVPVAAGRR